MKKIVIGVFFIILIFLNFMAFSKVYDFKYEIYSLPRVTDDSSTHVVYGDSIPGHNNGWGPEFPKTYEIVTIDLREQNKLRARIKQKQKERRDLLKHELSNLDSVSDNKLKKVLKLLKFLLFERELDDSELDG